MLKTSTEIASVAEIVGELKAVELVAKAGFDGYDLSLFEMARYDGKQVVRKGHPLQSKEALQYVRQIKQVAEDNGLVCNQSHAPHPVSCPEIRALMKTAIEFTAEAGGEIVVIHPDNNKNAAENAEMYLELLPYAKSCGVKIATENMWNWGQGQAAPAACSDPESFLAHLKAVNDPYFVACLDIGHAAMRGLNTSPAEMIRALGHHMQTLHIHDNDCHGDHHQLPFTMNIDFDTVVSALKEIGYNGWLTLETYRYCIGATPENVAEKVADMANAVKKIAEMIG
ncbi:MAG: sugar phosphate isomerase/epimerase [Oscillospiraceae bacterium]|nr:sugar phosphate isomerase/epimerase [Oscillospiraceae bacterium]